MFLHWDFPSHLESPRPRDPEKSQRSLSRGVWDPPTPDPPKVPKQVRSEQKSRGNNWFKLFSRLFRLVLELLGCPGSGGPELLSRDFFETFRGLGVLGSVDGRGDPNSCIKLSWSREVATQIPGHPGHSLFKTTENLPILGSQHPSPNVKKTLKLRNANLAEIITSRDMPKVLVFKAPRRHVQK